MRRVIRCRPFSTRILAILLLVLALALYCYYYNATSSAFNKPSNNAANPVSNTEPKTAPLLISMKQRKETAPPVEQCPVIKEGVADIDTVSIFPSFDFQPSWLRTREFWDRTFEERYENIKNESRRPRLKVFVVPHSHNDPGWLKTFEEYFEMKTKNIIHNIVTKLNEHPNMTFIWTEIAFLSAWWETSHPFKQKALKKLIKEGRLEITTGGWVMPDEACTHIYALIDQFIEGHHWVKNNLGVNPKIGWSIDPFGHGPTVPYILDKSGLEGAIIQRIHYAWKQWLARRQIEEFYWQPGWGARRPSLLVHNLPFDIYSIKSTCGPHPSVCLGYDFRKIPGEYSEYRAKQEEITDRNLHSKSKTLIEEYERIGSLTPHNVVLVPLGDDFRYEYDIEFDHQYVNYMKMFDYINSHKEHFDADVQFGTPLDYFNAVKQRHGGIPTLRGDFFVYSDIFSEGKPAYWSGYYTTRPYLKIVSRQLEHQLRTAEIIFTLVSNLVKQSTDDRLAFSEKKLEKHYEQLVKARRNLGLFQHHDAITGTSKAHVMIDYGMKLFTSLYHCIRLQETALTTVMIADEKLHSQPILQSEVEWENFGALPKKLQVSLVDRKWVIIFNSLTEPRTEVITLKANTTNIRVYDTSTKKYVLYQITPIIEIIEDNKRVVSTTNYEVQFVATLPPLTSVTYKLEEHTNTSNHCQVFCNSCNDNQNNDRAANFVTKKMMPGDIQLENNVLKLLVNRNNGFMRQVYRKDVRKKNILEVQFGAYQSAQRHSGAYLFMPDYDSPEKNVLHTYSGWNKLQDDNIIIVSGPVSTKIITFYVPFLIHTVTIYNVEEPELLHSIFVENVVDFGDPPKNGETELYMRIQTDIQNGEPPEMYTDQNGFQYQKRVKVSKLGIEANYYPITTMAWIEDEETRLTVLTDHAQGAAAFEPGRLEVMVDRRTLYDDFRGMEEGVVDNRRTAHRHWLLLEGVGGDVGGGGARRGRRGAEPFQRVHARRLSPGEASAAYRLPSLAALRLSRALNYPPNVYSVDTGDVGDIEVVRRRSFAVDFPPGVHLMTLRTITDDVLELFPSAACYMVLQRAAHSCSVSAAPLPLPTPSTTFTPKTRFKGLRIRNLTAVSLTGLNSYKSLSGMGDISLEPLEIKTYKVHF